VHSLDENSSNSDDIIIPEVVITSRKDASKQLKDNKARWPSFDAVISIGDPGDKIPHGFKFVPYRMRLEFEDTEDDEYSLAPNRDDIERIVKFAKYSKEREDDRLMIHCEAGQSRSSAAGFIYFATLLGPGSEDDAMVEMMRCCHQKGICPNELMISIADEILNRDGEMMNVFDEHFPPLPGEEVALG